MINIQDYEWLIVILLIIGVALLAVGVFFSIFIHYEKEELKEEKKFNKYILLMIAICIGFILNSVGGYFFVNHKYDETLEFVKTLEIQEIHTPEDTTSCYGYFSDSDGLIYKVRLDNLPIKLETNINNTEYEMIVTENETKIISPYTKDSLNYAETQKYIPFFDVEIGTFGNVFYMLMLLLLIWITVLFITVILDSSPVFFKVLAIISVLILIISGVFSFNYCKEQKQENIELLKEMDVILKDEYDLYSIDENGKLYKFSESEISESFRYKVNMKEFLILNEDLQIPFQYVE